MNFRRSNYWYFQLFLTFFLLVGNYSIYGQDYSKPQCDCNKDSIEAFIFYEKMASFPGGQKELMNYLGKTVEYPAEAINQKLEDKVLVEFCIECSGKISNIKVIRGQYEILNNEAYNVIQKMPNWEPAIAKGEPIATKYLIPINFELGSKTKKELRKEKHIGKNKC